MPVNVIKSLFNSQLQKLSSKRLSAERNENLDKMNNEELVEEKVAVQKALLYLESIHGRPSNKEDRNLVRPIYNRYRTLKRMVRLTTVSICLPFL